MKKIAILTSGGDAPGMNACIRACTRTAIDKGYEVYGVQEGYAGLMRGDLKKLTSKDVADIMQRGGTILKSARSKKFITDEGVTEGANALKNVNIDALIVIGGDGSFRGALDLSNKGINVICIPTTIDNDLAYTERTIGFDTACNTVLDAITKIRDTSSAHNRNVIIEVMGRNCGDLALYTGLTGGAELILIPEMKMKLDEIIMHSKINKESHKLHNIIIRAEGFHIDSSKLIEEIQQATGKDTKQVVLSYLQRGGSPSMNDRLIATLMGVHAIELIEKNSGCRAVGNRNAEIFDIDLEEALLIKPKLDEYKLKIVDILNGNLENC